MYNLFEYLYIYKSFLQIDYMVFLLIIYLIDIKLFVYQDIYIRCSTSPVLSLAPQQDNAAPRAVVHLSAPGDRLMSWTSEPCWFSLKNGGVSAGKRWENPIKKIGKPGKIQ